MLCAFIVVTLILYITSTSPKEKGKKVRLDFLIKDVPNGSLLKSCMEEVDQRRSKKKKITLGRGVKANADVEQLREGWTQCNFLMVQKGRLCNMARCFG